METTRDIILAAAADLLDQAGPDAVTLRAVAAIASVSHNAPYKHFQDKEALLAAVAADEFRARSEVMKALIARATDSVQALRLLAHDHVDWALAFPYRFRLLFGRWSRDHAALGEAAGAAQILFVESVARVGVADPIRAAAMLKALAHGAVDLALGGHLAADGKGGATPADLVEDLIDMLPQAKSSRDS